jgi:hypothetical protein
MPKPVIYANLEAAQAAFEAERPTFERLGASFMGATSYLPEPFRRDYRLAMDAQPTLATNSNSAVMAMLTTYIDPSVFEILFAPLKAARVLSEERKGDWLMETAAFPVVEHAGEVSSYGDYNNNGRASANTNWPQRQAYLFQTIVSYGDRELERAGLARINWVSELNRSAADLLNRFQNLGYLYGIEGLANYGMINDPNLPAPLTPATKAAGGVTWFTSGGAPNATANEVYNDIVSIFEALVVANNGLVDKDTKIKLVMSPGSSVALTFTNSFNVNVEDLLKKNFQNLTIETVPQYGSQTTANSQGNAAGNLLQMIADDIDGQKTGFCGFNEKLKSFPIVREMSAYKQKQMSGVWGSIIRMPVAFSQMLGV